MVNDMTQDFSGLKKVYIKISDILVLCISSIQKLTFWGKKKKGRSNL